MIAADIRLQVRIDRNLAELTACVDDGARAENERDEVNCRQDKPGTVAQKLDGDGRTLVLLALPSASQQDEGQRQHRTAHEEPEGFDVAPWARGG